MPITSPVLVTFTRFLACTFKKVWSNSALKSFYHRSYINISSRKNHVSVYFLGRVIPLSFSDQGKNTTFPGSTRKILSRRGPFWKDHLFRTIEENIIFPCTFLRKIIFHFPSRGKIIFSGKRNIIFPDNTRKIKFQSDFFGKTIISRRLEKENMVFCAVFLSNMNNS